MNRHDKPSIKAGGWWLALLGLFSACDWSSAAVTDPRPEVQLNSISFISVVVDNDTQQADNRLKRFLESVIAKSSKPDATQRIVRFPQETMPYGEVIRAFVERGPDKGYLARITPYAYVAAEMLGAKLDVLATYKSAATGDTTYHSYFVVPRELFDTVTGRKSAESRSDSSGEAEAQSSSAPTLEQLKTYLNALRGKPAKFIYHDRFSTSSYFLPSLYFRANHVFAMGHSINSELVPIQVERFPSTSSADLVGEVATGRADVAAVWDGTRAKFDNPSEADRALNDKVWFIKIDAPLPNDFLVASGVDAEIERAIIAGIAQHPEAGRKTGTEYPDDFLSWHVWDTNDDQVTEAARQALARLRRDAHVRPAPVIVKVEAGKDGAVSERYVQAAKEAVRLSGTEFVLEDKDLHKRVDMTWRLEPMHDGALKLTSTLDAAFGASSEEFAISFVDRNDLPKRIADLARSRLRRIRYVWPYEEKYPTVLRDLDFTPDRDVQVQKISWMDPASNEYEQDTPFRARIDDNTDFSKFRLSDEIKFPRNSDGSFNFEPMSNVAYRVVLSREPHAGWIWVVLPYCFIAFFVLACAGLVVDLRRRQPPPKGLQQTYAQMVEAYHRPWREQEIEEAEILWSDPKYTDEFVNELKTTGSALDVIRSGGIDFNFGPVPIRFSALMKLGSHLLGRRVQISSDLIQSSGVGNVAALDTLIQFLVRGHRLSPFVGFPEGTNHGSRPPAWPLEWEALNDIASRHFQQLGIANKEIDANLGTQNGALTSVVSSHFRGVIKQGTHHASLFRQSWHVGAKGERELLVWQGKLRTALPLRGDSGLARKVRLEIIMPPDAVLRGPSQKATLQAWVFGKLLDWSVEGEMLKLEVKPMAILRDYAHQH